jgi:hypothetical protein
MISWGEEGQLCYSFDSFLGHYGTNCYTNSVDTKEKPHLFSGPPKAGSVNNFFFEPPIRAD